MVRRVRDTNYQQELADHLPKDLETYGIHGLAKCPECGLSLVIYRNLKGVEFLGCQRYPLCLGARTFPGSAPPRDSLRELLLRTHARAVRILTDAIGRKAALEWWLAADVTRLLVHAHDPIIFEELLDSASALTDGLPQSHDFLDEAYQERAHEAHMFSVHHHSRLSALWRAQRIQQMPAPKFLKRWDTSAVRLVEIKLQDPDATLVGEYCRTCGTLAPEVTSPSSIGSGREFNKRFGGPAKRVFECPNCGKFDEKALPVSPRA